MTRTRGWSFPSPYSVLMIVIAVSAAATWLLPAGRYDQLSWDAATTTFTVTGGEESATLPGTQATLDSLGLAIPLAKFADGDIRRPVAVPDTYTSGEAAAQGIIRILQAPIRGLYDAIDIVFFVLVIGGFIGVFSGSGAFEAGIAALAHKLKGREEWLIIIVTTLFALGGTTFGMAEETIAFYPILVPIFLAAGYDVMVPLAVIFVGAGMGFMASTVNPFATIIASDAAGINWTAGLPGRVLMLVVGTVTCIAYIIRYARRVKADPATSLATASGSSRVPAAVGKTDSTPEPMDGRTRILLGLFALTFAVMIFGVSRLGWWFLDLILGVGSLRQGPIDKRRRGRKTFLGAC